MALPDTTTKEVQDLGSIQVTSDRFSLPEAPASLNFRIVSPAGLEIQVTLRDFDETTLFTRMVNLSKWMTEKGFQFPGKPQAAPSNSPANPAPVAPVNSAPGNPAPSTGGEFHTTKMVVKAQDGGKVTLEFWSGGQYYDIAANKVTVEKAIQLLALTGTWKPEHFIVPAGQASLTYSPVNFKIKWEQGSAIQGKPGKFYKNIKSIELA